MKAYIGEKIVTIFKKLLYLMSEWQPVKCLYVHWKTVVLIIQGD